MGLCPLGTELGWGRHKVFLGDMGLQREMGWERGMGLRREMGCGRGVCGRVGFLPAKNLFLPHRLNRFKLVETWFKPAKTVTLDKFFLSTHINLS